MASGRRCGRSGTAEKVIQNIETDVPGRSARCHEAVTHVGPKIRRVLGPRASKFPTASIEATPLALTRIGIIGSRRGYFGNMRRGRSLAGEPYRASNRTQVTLGVEGRPLAQMQRVGKPLPDFFQ